MQIYVGCHIRVCIASISARPPNVAERSAPMV